MARSADLPLAERDFPSRFGSICWPACATTKLQSLSATLVSSQELEWEMRGADEDLRETDEREEPADADLHKLPVGKSGKTCMEPGVNCVRLQCRQDMYWKGTPASLYDNSASELTLESIHRSPVSLGKFLLIDHHMQAKE